MMLMKFLAPLVSGSNPGFALAREEESDGHQPCTLLGTRPGRDCLWVSGWKVLIKTTVSHYKYESKHGRMEASLWAVLSRKRFPQSFKGGSTLKAPGFHSGIEKSGDCEGQHGRKKASLWKVLCRKRLFVFHTERLVNTRLQVLLLIRNTIICSRRN